MNQPKLLELGEADDGLNIKDVVALEITKKMKEKKNGAEKKLKEIVKEHLSLTNADSEPVQIPKPNDFGNGKGGNLVTLQSLKLTDDKEEEKKGDNTQKKRTEIGDKNQMKMKIGESTSSSSNDDSDDEIHDKKKHQSVNNKERKVIAPETEKTKKNRMETEEKNKDKKKNSAKKKVKKRREASSSSESDEDIHDKKSRSPLMQHLQSNKWIWLGALGSLLVLVGGAVLKVMNTQQKSRVGAQEEQISENQQRKKQRSELCICCRNYHQHKEFPMNNSESKIHEINPTKLNEKSNANVLLEE